VGLTTPTRILEFAPTSNPLTGAPVWIDITTRLIKGSIRRGRQHELGTFQAGTMNVTLDNRDGALNAWNSQSPFYNTGTGIQPFKPVRLRAVWNGVTYAVFRGFIESFGPQWQDAVNSEIELRCVDGFKLLALATIDRSGYDEAVIADGASHYWKLNEPNGILYNADAIGTLTLRQGMPQVLIGGSASLLVADTDTCEYWFNNSVSHLYGDTVVSRDAAFSVEFWAKPYPTTPPPGDTIVCQGVGDPSTGNTYEWFVSMGTGASGGVSFSVYVAGGLVTGGTVDGSLNLYDNKPHHIVCVHGTSADKIYVDGVDVTIPYTFHAGAPQTLSGSKFVVGSDPTALRPLETYGGWLQKIAYYPLALSAAQAAAHASLGLTPWSGDLSGARINRVLDLIGWPAADRSIDVGQSVMAQLDPNTIGSSALSYLQSVELSELGALFISPDGKVSFHQRDKVLKPPYNTSQLTLGPANEPYELDGTQPVGDDTQIYNDVVAQRSGGSKYTVVDTASIAAFGRRPLQETSLLNTSDVEVLDRANYRLFLQKSFSMRTEKVHVHPIDDAGNLFPHALGRELRERITFVRSFIGQGDAMTQVSLIEGIDHDLSEDDWTTDWSLEPAPPAFWIVGTSALGTDTRLAA
jgi:hypothetical protein